MKSDLYKKTKEFIQDSFDNDEGGMRHFERTVYWLRQLKPDADEAFLIAALSHDVERGKRDKATFDKIRRSTKGFTDKDFLDYHQTTSAQIMADFLKEQGADDQLTERVKMLISKHEVGGNEDQNLLKDADSLSFLENNINFFIEKKIPELGKEKVKEKINWMFNRITSPSAKNISQQWYNNAIKKLK